MPGAVGLIAFPGTYFCFQSPFIFCGLDWANLLKKRSNTSNTGMHFACTPGWHASRLNVFIGASAQRAVLRAEVASPGRGISEALLSVCERTLSQARPNGFRRALACATNRPEAYTSQDILCTKNWSTHSCPFFVQRATCDGCS